MENIASAEIPALALPHRMIRFEVDPLNILESVRQPGDMMQGGVFIVDPRHQRTAQNDRSFGLIQFFQIFQLLKRSL